jgi:hypothetical protein
MSYSTTWPASNGLAGSTGLGATASNDPIGQAAKDMAGYSAQAYEQAVNDAKASLARKITEANIKRAGASLDALANM